MGSRAAGRLAQLDTRNGVAGSIVVVAGTESGPARVTGGWWVIGLGDAAVAMATRFAGHRVNDGSYHSDSSSQTLAACSFRLA